MVQAASSSAGLRTIKRVEQTLQDLGVCLYILYSWCHFLTLYHTCWMIYVLQLDSKWISAFDTIPWCLYLSLDDMLHKNAWDFLAPFCYLIPIIGFLFYPLEGVLLWGLFRWDWLWFQFLYKDFCFILAYPNSCTRLVGILVWAKHYTNIIDFSCYEFCARNRFRGFLKCRFSTCIVMHSHHRYHFFNCLC
jgi:hypothetical protein